MPEGYACDDCGEFSRFTHKATRINFAKVYNEIGEDCRDVEKILCPDCAQKVWNAVTGREPPEEVWSDD